MVARSICGCAEDIDILLMELEMTDEDRPIQGGSRIAYIRHVLGELRVVADEEGCQMLCYLLEMAYLEAGDIQLRGRRSKIGH